MEFDLHCHTTNSDGVTAPDKISDVLKNNLVWTVTDHNDINYHKTNKISLTGTELTTEVKVGDTMQVIEVLAYGFDIKRLSNTVAILKAYSGDLQRYYFSELLERVRNLGCKLDDTIPLNKSGFAHDTVYEELCKYAENKKILGNLMDSGASFYHNGQSEGSLIYIEPLRAPFTLMDISALVKLAGGQLILAHPYYYKAVEVVDLLWSVSGFVDGIECLHPSAGVADARSLVQFCVDNKLLASGGSDYHKGQYLGTPYKELSTMGEKGSPFNWILDYV